MIKNFTNKPFKMPDAVTLRGPVCAWDHLDGFFILGGEHE